MNEFLKKKIQVAMATDAEKLGSANKLARKLNINPAQVSRVLSGEFEGVLSDAKWYSIAGLLSVPIDNRVQVIAAVTETFAYIQRQLSTCQTRGISLLLCDEAGIGKTFAARHYVAANHKSVLIDCSQVKSKQRLVRHIAKQFGLDATGRYADVYDSLVFYLKATPGALIILDEAGDLDYPAFLELKALWNATEGLTGWYMMGADGLRAKIDINIGHKKVGYSELFRRFGENIQRVSPLGGEEAKSFHKKQVSLVAKANGVADVQKLYAKTGGSLTRVALEIEKLKLKADEQSVISC